MASSNSSFLIADEANAFLQKVLKKMNLECTPPLTNSRMIDKLVGEYIEEQCVNPSFVCARLILTLWDEANTSS